MRYTLQDTSGENTLACFAPVFWPNVFGFCRTCVVCHKASHKGVAVVRDRNVAFGGPLLIDVAVVITAVTNSQ